MYKFNYKVRIRKYTMNMRLKNGNACATATCLRSTKSEEIKTSELPRSTDGSFSVFILITYFCFRIRVGLNL